MRKGQFLALALIGCFGDPEQIAADSEPDGSATMIISGSTSTGSDETTTLPATGVTSIDPTNPPGTDTEDVVGMCDDGTLCVGPPAEWDVVLAVPLVPMGCPSGFVPDPQQLLPPPTGECVCGCAPAPLGCGLRYSINTGACPSDNLDDQGGCVEGTSGTADAYLAQLVPPPACFTTAMPEPAPPADPLRLCVAEMPSDCGPDTVCLPEGPRGCIARQGVFECPGPFNTRAPFATGWDLGGCNEDACGGCAFNCDSPVTVHANTDCSGMQDVAVADGACNSVGAFTPFALSYDSTPTCSASDPVPLVPEPVGGPVTICCL